MFSKIVVGVLVMLSLYGYNPQRAIAEPQIILSPKETISLFALKYGASEKELNAVAKCESGFNPNAIHYNDGGKGKHSVGVFQYQESTFKGFSKLMNEDLDYYSYQDQIKLTAYIYAKYPKYKSHWTCYRIYKKSLA